MVFWQNVYYCRVPTVLVTKLAMCVTTTYVLVTVVMSSVYMWTLCWGYWIRVKFQSISPLQPYRALIQLHFEETTKLLSL